jgi:Ni2+-binding GTPase involved in maturation of urease and hydrogenase
MEQTKLIIVGGFLGAGKTTLLYETTKQLMQQGKRIGLVTNDQAPELVDTAMLLHADMKVAELSGSCFCCNFNGFIHSLRQVREDSHADILIAEPVGSCTDLSATLMQPLKEKYSTELNISPLTVLVDPFRLADILDGGNAGLHPSAAYIFRKQMEESDILLITKTDLLSQEELNQLEEKVKFHFPDHEVLAISSKTGNGVNEWINKVLKSTESGSRIIEVDYDRYAEGEALLGWLNSTLSLKGELINWDDFARSFLIELSKRIDQQGAGVGHVKIIVKAGTNQLVGNLTGSIETLSIRGIAGISNYAQLIINSRVEMAAELLDQLVRETLNIVTDNRITVRNEAWKSLSPGYPNPTYRYKKVVAVH